MAQSSPPPPGPNSQSQTIIYTSPPPPSPPLPPPSSSFTPFSFPNRPPVRVTSEFDSDTGIFFQKISSKFFNGLAKLKFSFESTTNGEISDPQVAIVTKNLDIRYDVVEKNALVKGFFDVGPNLRLTAFHDVKAQQGELSMLANLSDPGYKFELTSFVPSVRLPRATLRFPCGELSLEEREDDEEKRVLSINGIAKGSLLNGLCTAMYSNETLNLRYCYKDEEVSFIPSISLPSNAVSIAFKRRFGPADKLSYWYNFDTNSWSSVYKHTVGKDYKFKAGYDSEVRLGWASLWVGDEGGKAKTAPMKMKVQFMLQVPQDDLKTSALMFRVKKRWDI